jgi:hypothetical protein
MDEKQDNEQRNAIRGEPWFDDGNIILEADSTRFRVYRGILSASSPIFADMLSVPQPTTSTEILEGCPVVCVSDPAKDWQIVLETLYQRRCFQAVVHPLNHAYHASIQKFQV